MIEKGGKASVLLISTVASGCTTWPRKGHSGGDSDGHGQNAEVDRKLNPRPIAGAGASHSVQWSRFVSQACQGLS